MSYETGSGGTGGYDYGSGDTGGYSYGDYGAPQRSSFWERLIGVATFKGPIYREIAKDSEATGAAAGVVIGFSVLAGLLGGLLLPLQLGAQLQDPEIQRILAELNIDPALFVGGGTILLSIINAIVTPIASLIGWLIFGWLNGVAAKNFFKGDTNTGEILRVFGFAYIWAPLSAIPCIGLLASILSIISNVIGIREAAGFDTGNAVLTWLVSVAIIIGVFIALFACLFGMIALLAAGASGA